MNNIGDHLTGGDTGIFCSGAIANIATTADESNANSIHDDIRGHGDGEADKGVGKGFSGAHDFARFAGRENILVATVDNIGEDKIGSNDGDVGSDVGGDGPDVVFDALGVGDYNSAIPRG